MVISKNLFCNVVKEVKCENDFYSALFSVYLEYAGHGDPASNYLASPAVRLLQDCLGVDDNLILDWVFEQDKFDTPEELYEYVIKTYTPELVSEDTFLSTIKELEKESYFRTQTSRILNYLERDDSSLFFENSLESLIINILEEHFNTPRRFLPLWFKSLKANRFDNLEDFFKVKSREVNSPKKLYKFLKEKSINNEPILVRD